MTSKSIELGRKLSTTQVVHKKLSELYLEFLFCGGLPEAVKVWCEYKSFFDRETQVRKIHRDLLRMYKEDFGKYAESKDALNILALWEQSATHLSRYRETVKRFKFKGIVSSKRGFKGLKDYFHYLKKAGLVTISYVVESPMYPLKSCSKEALFKCFWHDTGLLLAQLDFSFKALISGTDISYKGFISENWVANELEKSKPSSGLHSWMQNTAEIEFLLQTASGNIIPIEVKNNNPRARSLDSF